MWIECETVERANCDEAEADCPWGRPTVTEEQEASVTLS